MVFISDHHFWNRQFNPETMYSSINPNPIYVFIRKLLKRTEAIWLRGFVASGLGMRILGIGQGVEGKK